MSVLPIGINGESGGYNIERSLRFNSADSAYLSRTPGSAGNRKTWTWSAWVKRGDLSTATRGLFGAGTASTTDTGIYWTSADKIDFFDRSGGSLTGYVSTNAVFRDPSAWYHVVVVFDSGNATAANRMLIYVNNVSQSLTVNNTLPQDTQSAINNTVGHNLGSLAGASNFGNGYMADVHFIDGSALTPSSFGENDTDTGVWKPKAYTGSYGTNGFKLTFSDNSGTTATTLGKDTSGNGNNWTPNNFSVTAGAGNDSLVDTPTPYGSDTGAGGEVRGNYCTLNPLTTTAGTYTDGNLRFVGASSWRRSNATIPLSTGKWYWEVTLGNAPNATRVGGAYNAFGFGLSTTFNSTTDPSGVTDAVVLADNGYYKNFSGSFTDGGTAFSNGDTLSIAVDLDSNSYTFRRNNTQIATGTIGGTAGRELVPIIISYNGSYGVMDCNFGQRPFAYTAPSGYKALCTTNLPTPAIGATSTTRANKHFDATLFTGTGTSLSVVNAGGFKPDLVWTKRRDNAGNNLLANVLSGVDKYLISESTAAEATGAQLFTSFNNDGFSMGTSGYANGASVVAWQWKANGAGSSNTQGTITSTVSANTTSGFSIVTYTGNGTNGATIGHGLGVSPAMVIVKRRNASGDHWPVWHTSLGNNAGLYLDLTNASYSSSAHVQSVSSTTFTVGTDTDANTSGGTYVAYCFAPVAGYSAFGSYVGNGSSTDGTFVYTGFKPRFILIKMSSGAYSWGIWDTARNTYNVVNSILFPDLSNAEASAASVAMDVVSNGFKMRGDGSNFNGNGSTYIYAAFAEHPFKYALAQ